MTYTSHLKVDATWYKNINKIKQIRFQNFMKAFQFLSKIK